MRRNVIIDCDPGHDDAIAIIVALANIVDINVICDGHVLKTVTVVFYICNECISLIENAGRIGVPVPKKLLDVLEQLRDKDDK